MLSIWNVVLCVSLLKLISYMRGLGRPCHSTFPFEPSLVSRSSSRTQIPCRYCLTPLLEQHVPGLSTHTRKNSSPISQLPQPSGSLKLFPLVLRVQTLFQSPSPAILEPQQRCKVSLEPSVLQIGHPQLSQTVLEQRSSTFQSTLEAPYP